MHGWQVIRDFFYGMTGYQFVHHAREMKYDSEALFFTVTLGDLIGVPIMPPVYSLRLLPYVVPEIAAWKRQLPAEENSGKKRSMICTAFKRAPAPIDG